MNVRVNRIKGLRSRYIRYSVSVYLSDDLIEDTNYDRLNIPLIRLYSGTVVAKNERMAAAHGWINIVGQYRLMSIETCDVPDFIRDSMVDPQSVSDQLIKSSLSPICGGYLLDNLVEVWFISVQEAS